ncbi:hypothetical protein E0198_002185 [Clavispora lusitaniae]|nr:hypothetical protein E0198_002185 [Clavispora lusitaniae]
MAQENKMCICPILSTRGENMAKGGHSHRTTLKKEHKPFKSKHASKGSLKNQFKGKVEKSTTGNNKSIRVMSKAERKNTSKQLKEKKILDTKMSRRLFEGSSGAEKIITIIGLTDDINTGEILGQLVNSLKEEEDDVETEFSAPRVYSLRLPRFKNNVKFVLPDPNDFISILDAAKASDYVVFGLSAEQEVEKEYGEQILRAVVAQGVATVLGVVPNLVSAYPKKNLQQDIRQSLQSFFSHFFPNEDKLFALENTSECLNCIRAIAQKFPKSVNWRDARAYILADQTYWHGEGESGFVVVEGTARGIGFNANRLVHIPGHGDFQLERIEKITKHKNDEGDVFTPTSEQEGLEELNPEEFDMEDDFQYDDMGVQMEGKNYFDDNAGPAARKYKVPKGTSEYQSKWLLDDVLEGASDVEEEGDDEEVEMEMENMDDAMEVNGLNGSEQMDMDDMDDRQTVADDFVELSPQEEEEQLRQYREMEKEDREFPDEIELAPSESAKEKLREYRGIKSLGTCDWDWDEYDSHRPSIYSRLLHITNFKATRNKIHKDAIKEAQVNIGSKVRLFIRAPKFVLDNVDVLRAPFVVYSLLAHEHKLAVTNFSFQTWEDHEEPVPSGENIVVQYGFRRQVISPMFNQASNTSNNVHKYERFAHQGNLSIATAIAPVLFYNAPALFFKPGPDGSIQMVGQGTFLNCDHTRVAAERVVLTGHPVKIHKRLVTVRYMFFHVEDINWFKAVPLFTKSGRTGFIKESLGTHGYFKCTFDGRLTAQDVVAMALYRRVWPSISEPY